MRRLPYLMLLFVLGLTAALLSCSRLRVFQPSRPVKPDVIGAVLPLSGPYQPVGEAMRAGISLALSGSKLRLVVRDSKGEPEAAAQAVEELAVQEQAIAILGGSVGEEAKAAAERAQALGVTLLTFSKAEDITDEGNYVFRNMPTVQSQARDIAHYASCGMGMRRFAVMRPEAEYAETLTRAFIEAVESEGGSVKEEILYSPEQTTFTQEAQRLTGRASPEKRADFIEGQRKIAAEEKDPTRRRRAMEKLRKSLPPIVDVQALFLPDGWKTVSLIAPALAYEDLVTNACDPEDIARIQKTMGTRELKTVTLLGWGGWSAPLTKDGVSELLTRGGKYLHCSVFVDAFFPQSKRPATRRFVQRYQDEYAGKWPSVVEALAYDSASMLRTVAERSIDSSSDFRDALAELEGFDGATGTTSFNRDREAQKAPFYLRIDPSGIRELSPPAECRAPVAKAH